MLDKRRVRLVTELYLYFLVHIFFKGFLHPVWFFNSVRRCVRKGRKAAWIDVFGRYVPSNYGLKTVVHTKEPSLSILKKIKLVLPDDFFSVEPVSNMGVSFKQRILVVRAGAMGDVILLTPIIREIFNRRGGECSIDVATRYPEVFKNSPYVSKVYSPSGLRKSRKNYDLIINLDMAIERNKSMHITTVYKFYAFGVVEAMDDQPELFSTLQDKLAIQELIKIFPQGYIVCHNRDDESQPYRNVALKDWKKLLQKVSEHTGLPVLQVGGKGDVGIEGGKGLIDMRGKFSLQELRELVASSKLFIGTDAGPLHVASCTSTPIVAFFTLAHHSVRQPLRRDLANQFVPITPQVSCYGCAKEYPFVWGFECHRGDAYCTRAFDVQEAVEASIGFIN